MKNATLRICHAYLYWLLLNSSFVVGVKRDAQGIPKEDIDDSVEEQVLAKADKEKTDDSSTQMEIDNSSEVASGEPAVVKEKRNFGSITDEDVIKTRASEKKKVSNSVA